MTAYKNVTLDYRAGGFRTTTECKASKQTKLKNYNQTLAAYNIGALVGWHNEKGEKQSVSANAKFNGVW
jgi:hypothetical protein